MKKLTALVATAALAVPALVGLTPSAAAAPPVSQATGTVTVGSNPYDVAVAQNLGQAFVVNDGSVSVVSLLTHRQLATVGTGVGHGQNGIALLGRNTHAYITNFETTKVLDFDTETRTVKRSITVGAGAVDVAKANTPKGQRAYVALLPSNRLVGIRASTGRIVQRITLPQAPQTVTAAADGRTVWVGSAESGRVYVVNTSTGGVTRTIRVDRAGPVSSIAFTPDGKRAWVAGLGGVSVVDVVSGRTVKFLPILSLFTSDGPNMGPVALTGSGRQALVVDSTFPDEPGPGTVTVVDTRTFKVLEHVRTGMEPVGLAVDAKRRTAFATNYADDTLSILTTGR
jgi:YVTN family beta-propeller protein